MIKFAVDDRWLLAHSVFEQLAAFERCDMQAQAPRVQTQVAPQVSNGTAAIPVRGVLVAERNPMFEFFGVEHTVYSDISSALASAEANGDVSDVVLQVASPGGQVAGLFEALESINAFSKPIRAVATQAESAAYAIAASTDGIEATGPAAQFGSVGVVATFSVPENQVTITSTEAPDKRPDLTTESGQAVVREHLDAVHELFVGAIGSGRSISAETVNKDFGRGRTFLAAEALSRGMIDSVGSTPAASATSQEAATAARSKPTMNIETLKCEHPDVYNAVVAIGHEQGVAAERDRVNAHLKLGQMGNVERAHQAIKEGELLTQELTADYLAAAVSRRDQSARAADESVVASALKDSTTLEAPAAASKEDEFADAFAAELEALRGKAC